MRLVRNPSRRGHKAWTNYLLWASKVHTGETGILTQSQKPPHLSWIQAQNLRVANQWLLSEGPHHRGIPWLTLSGWLRGLGLVLTILSSESLSQGADENRFRDTQIVESRKLPQMKRERIIVTRVVKTTRSTQLKELKRKKNKTTWFLMVFCYVKRSSVVTQIFFSTR